MRYCSDGLSGRFIFFITASEGSGDASCRRTHPGRLFRYALLTVNEATILKSPRTLRAGQHADERSRNENRKLLRARDPSIEDMLIEVDLPPKPVPEGSARVVSFDPSMGPSNFNEVIGKMMAGGSRASGGNGKKQQRKYKISEAR